MKHTKKASYFLAGVMTALLLVNMVVPALAAGLEKLISVSTGVSIYTNGVKLDPRDANGNPVDVFIYNGTTYLPVRAVSDALGVPVQWDGSTRSVYLGNDPRMTNYLPDVCPPYQSHEYKTPATFKMAGVDYAHGFTLRCHGGYALFNLNGSYNTLEFDLGFVEGDKVDCHIDILLDGQVSQSIEMGSEDLPKHFVVPLNGALQLKIVNGPYGNTGCYGFANAEVY